MITLKAPEGTMTASVEGHAVEIVNGVCTVNAATAEALKSHGFIEIAADSKDDPRKEMTDLEVNLSLIAKADRPEMFAMAKKAGIALAASMKTENMREALSDFVRKAYAEMTPKPPEPGKGGGTATIEHGAGSGQSGA